MALIVYATYLLLWISEFVTTGVLDSDAEAKEVFARLVGLSSFACFGAICIFATVIDWINFRYVIPLAFLVRAFCCGSYQFTEDPSESYALLLQVTFEVSTYILVASNEALYVRDIPREIAGIMQGIIITLTLAAAFTFNLVSGRLFDTMEPHSPFCLLSILDLVVCVLAIGFACYGHLDRTTLKSS